MKLNKIDPKKTAVLVIDMQNDFVRPGGPLFSQMGCDLLNPMAHFLDRCRQMGMLVIYTRNTLRPDGRDMGNFGEFCTEIKEGKACVAGTEGAEICGALAPKDCDIVVVKHRYSAFFRTDLETLLKGSDIKTVAITGVCTDACCLSTARDAGFLDFDVVFLSDLTGTVDYADAGFGPISAEDMHLQTLNLVAQTTGDVMTSERFFELAK